MNLIPSINISNQSLNSGSRVTPVKDDFIILKEYPNIKAILKNPMIPKNPINALSFAPSNADITDIPLNAMKTPKNKNSFQFERGYFKESLIISPMPIYCLFFDFKLMIK